MPRILVVVLAVLAAPALAQPAPEGPFCCNTLTGQYEGSMTAEACLEQEGRVPDIEPYLVEAGACRPPVQSGPNIWGGPDREEREEAFEENLSNGDFENWSGAKPSGMASYASPPQAPITFETVRRSPTSYTGGVAIRIENKHVRIPNMPANLPQFIAPGGVITCKSNCPLYTDGGVANGQIPSTMRFLVQDPKPFVCGAYIGEMVGGDKAVLSVIALNGDNIVGGTGMGPNLFLPLSDLPTASSTEWTEFKIPLAFPWGRPANLFNQATVQAHIVPGSLVDGSLPGRALAVAMNPMLALSGGMDAISVHEGSYFILDSIHLCGSKAEIDLHLPEYVEDGRSVREDDKETKGGLVWVNVDNDDGDLWFDNQDDDGVSGENDLAELVLRFPNAEVILPLQGVPQEGRLVVSGDPSRYRLWEDKEKNREFTRLDEWMDLPDLLTSVEGEDRIRRLWVEGVEPSGGARDLMLEFSVRDPEKPSIEDSDRVALTVLAIDEMEWIGNEGNSENDDDQLTADPTYPGGLDGEAVRVFPGARWRGNAPGGALDRVKLKVTLNAEPPVPVTLGFRSFDMDDPSATDDEVDDESSDDDNRGDTAGTPAGAFFGSGSDTVAEVFSEKEKELTLRLPMQPGDNVRVAGFIHDPDEEDILPDLHNDDTKLAEGGPRALSSIVDRGVWDESEDAMTATFDRPHLSDLLTVWRFMWTEVDGMEPVQGTIIRGGITDVSQNLFTGVTTLSLSLNFTAQGWAQETAPDGLLNMFEGGSITIYSDDGGLAGAWPVAGNSAWTSAPDEVYIDGAVAADLEWATFELIDDGRSHGFGEGEAIPMPDLSRIEPVYEEVYVVARHNELPNGTPTVPYVWNSFYDTAEDLTSTYRFNNDAHDDTPDFWIVYIMAGHQGAQVEDGDGNLRVVHPVMESLNRVGAPEDVLSGYADTDKKGVAIFAEGIYERLRGNVVPTTSKGLGAGDTVAHEIGHLFGAEHVAEGLMSAHGDGALFSDESKKTIRSARHP